MGAETRGSLPIVGGGAGFVKAEQFGDRHPQRVEHDFRRDPFFVSRYISIFICPLHSRNSFTKCIEQFQNECIIKVPNSATGSSNKLSASSKDHWVKEDGGDGYHFFFFVVDQGDSIK